jgi:hypothetical protein
VKLPLSEMGCCRTVPSDGASSRERREGSISPPAVDPIMRSTLPSSGWITVYVAWWKKQIRERAAAGNVDHRVAAFRVEPPNVIAVGAMDGSPGCPILGSSYVPGALQFTGSPAPVVLKRRNCGSAIGVAAGPASFTCASARSGFRSTAAGMPVASARKPT